MKQFLLTFITIASLYNTAISGENRATNAISLNDEATAIQSISNSSIGIPQTTNEGDTLIIFFDVPALFESEGVNASRDTLKVSMGFRTNSTGVGIEVTIIRPFLDDTTFDVSNKANYSLGTIPFIENTTDSIKIIVNQGALVLNASGFRIYSIDGASNSSSFNSPTVITDIKDGLFNDENVHITNPVSNGLLTIHLPSDARSTEVELLSLEGNTVLSQEISPSHRTIDVSGLKGLYLLREVSTGSIKKIIIK